MSLTHNESTAAARGWKAFARRIQKEECGMTPQCHDPRWKASDSGRGGLPPASAPVRVLHAVDSLTQDSGAARILLRYEEHLDRSRVVFDFLVSGETDPEIGRALTSKGARIFTAPPLKARSLAAYVVFVRQLLKEHGEYRIVHCHLPNAALFCLGAARSAGVPVRIQHSHCAGSGGTVLKSLRNRLLFSLIPLCCNLRFACSETAGTFLFGKRTDTNLWHVMHNALQPEDYTPSPETRQSVRAELGVAPSAFVVGHLGRLSPEKNQTFLLKVFQAFHQSHPDSRLVIAGSGKLEQSLRRAARELLPDEAVLWLGIRRDVPRLLQAMDILVMPSFFEGLPLAALEAQAAGVPCLLSDRITGEAAVATGLVRFASLEQSPGEWARMIEETAPPHGDSRGAFRAAGYDVTLEAEKLMRAYELLYRDGPSAPGGKGDILK